VFVALGIHHKMRVLHIVICGLPGSTIFLHCIIKGMIFVKKKLWDVKCVFLFYVQLLPVTFLILIII